ncbi:MAG: hypothetical protein QXJ68_07440 [Methanocellales archaeon]
MSKVIIKPLPSQEDYIYKCIKIEGETIAIPICIFICEIGRNAKMQDAKFIYEKGIYWYICEREFENRIHIEKEIGDRNVGVITLLDCPDKAEMCKQAEKLGLHIKESIQI